MPAEDSGFVKKERKGNFRKKEKAADEEESEDVRKAIEETRLEHKLRARVAGVQSEKLAVNPAVRREVVAEVEGDAGTSMLDNQFSTEAQVDNSHVGLMEQQMLKYIDKKLKGEDGQEQEEKRVKTKEDELYEIPEHLQIKGKAAGAFGQKSAEEVQDNGAETWLTGIVEVELPMDDKLRNIEDTERAKKKILEERMRGYNSSAFIVDTTSEKGYSRADSKDKKKRRNNKDDKPGMDKKHAQLARGGGGNFSVNFVQRGGTREIREAAAGQAAHGGGGGGDRRSELSSDDLVMERFKKRFCMKK